jgi:prolycopene isomerase
VTTADGEQYEARVVVSNISPYALHSQLLPQEARSKRWGIRLGNLNPSVSCVGVYLGMASGAERLLPSCLNFWYGSTDHEALFAQVLANRGEPLDHLFLLRSAEPSPNPAFLLMQYVQQSASQNWKQDKLRYAERMVDLAERVVPGIKQNILLTEVGSPDTYARYTGNTAGALYGFENTSALYGEARMPVRTNLDNLFQTGHWQRPGGGVWNVTVNGYAVAKSILNSTP